ncbi:hypothetical protein Q73_08350 [Bacillus coahuilensis m2-6]|uniref:CPBP family intramembrane glutamic endopeptidase n=2 Tax=Bacillus coahuilensis TaxID=408580 RepID=UPI0007503485|nr:CPBP family intramembrane glutamic endopeptidase [Bacillus coahuilensis]KUP07810.1 hypothetical protein Q73_08350 [Bacillus coahuilensis m2-6]
MNNIQQLTEKQLNVALYSTQLLLLVLCFALAFLLDISLLTIMENSSISIGMVWASISVGLVIVVVDIIGMIRYPTIYDDGGINQTLFATKSYLHIFVLTLFIAISEELFFRGVLQSYFGLIPVSLFFALIHFRYLKNWYLVLNVLIVSFLLGYSYELTESLFVPITIHFVIDFLLACWIRLKGRK